MRRLLLAAGPLLGLALTAQAQTVPGCPICTSAIAAASLSPTLPNSDIYVGNGSNVATPVALSGDATLANTGAISVTKTGGVAFSSFATGTDAANLTGNVAVARIATALTTPGPIGGTTPSTGAFTSLQLGAGSVSSPSLRLAADTNTGLYSDSANSVVVALAGNITLEFAAANRIFAYNTSGNQYWSLNYNHTKGMALSADGNFGFTTTNNDSTAAYDVNISRVSAGVMACGTGAQGSTACAFQLTKLSLRNGVVVASLPSGTTGDMMYVTDAVACTFLATITGGGSTVCPVFYNGSAWVGG